MVASVPRVLAAQAPPRAEVDSVLGALVETHGVSGMEAPVRETVQRFLPAWALASLSFAAELRVGAAAVNVPADDSMVIGGNNADEKQSSGK